MDGTEDDLLWDTDEEAETDSPDTEWDPLWRRCQKWVRTYLTNSLPRTTNIMILQKFKYIIEFVLFYNGFCV
jgi:hypothetical protein